MNPEIAPPVPQASPSAAKAPPPTWGDFRAPGLVAIFLLIAAAGWFLLKELAPLLRPLLLAAFLGYVIYPMHLSFKERMTGWVSLTGLVVVTAAVVLLLAWIIYTSAVELRAELPDLMERAVALIAAAQGLLREHAPWLTGDARPPGWIASEEAARIKAWTQGLVNIAADALTEAVVVALYLFFFLVEAHRMPRRIENAFSDERGARMLAIVGHINRSIADYLKAKVRTSLIVAVPITVILWLFGVKFAVLLGVLTFFGNFIPYVGSIVACILPIIMAFLQFETGWRPATAAACIITIHVTTAFFIEPAMIGRGVGLSPVVILASLAFWGLCWGLPGMLLAVPLTVTLKIILSNIEVTRPLARMIADE